MIILLAFLVDGVFGADPDEVIKNMSVNEGDSVTLNSSVTKKQEDIMQWYFDDIRIAHINGDPEKTCFYDGEGKIFRDTLEVDYETGSLIITNIRPEHTGHYEAELIRSESSGKGENLNRNSKCNSTKIIRKNSLGNIIKTFSVTVKAADPGKADSQMDIKEQETDNTVPGSDLSAGAVAGISFAVVLLLVAAVGVIYYRHRRSRKDREIRKQELLQKA